MSNEALELIRSVVKNWLNDKKFTFEKKDVHPYNSPMVNGEFVLRFTISVDSFYCGGKLIPIALTSRPFHTNTLSENPLSQNVKGDKYRLERLLEEFDNLFYTEVDNKLNDCIETLTTSDPLFFK